jgi:tetratricopeptide (TPR) repeat protein
VRHAEERFWMLETIREFAIERLRESTDGEVLRRRHADHFLLLAEEAEPHLPAYDRVWVRTLEREHDNLRSAIDWLEAAEETQLALRLAGALGRFWLVKGFVREGHSTLARLLEEDLRPTLARAKALTALVNLSNADRKSRGHADEALALATELEDPAMIATAKLGLASCFVEEDLPRARLLYEESAEAFRELGDDHLVLIAIRSLAWAHALLGDDGRARELHEENLRLARELGNERIEAITLGVVALYAADDGHIERAVAMLKESHALHMRVGDPVQMNFAVWRFAALLATAGHAAAATTVLSASDALANEAGIDLNSWDPTAVPETLEKIRARLEEAAVEKAWQEGRTLTVDQAVELALDALEG